MPTVVRDSEFEFVVHTREKPYEPPHVHVYFSGRGQGVRLAINSGRLMDEPPAGKRAAILKAYRRHALKIREAWDRIHRR